MNAETTLHLDQSYALAEHAALQRSYDEMREATGALRPHWEYVRRSLEALGPQELLRREQEARRLLRENGVTYNVYGDPLGTDRPWSLDAIPLLIPPEEWSYLEAGLIQRARLLNSMRADFYGT
jgi:uncharacterized circularly permuted ATP-grasp superfamily protein